jgi:hypothetical protein
MCDAVRSAEVGGWFKAFVSHKSRPRGIDSRGLERYNHWCCGDDRLRRGRLSIDSKPGSSGPVNNGAQILSANDNTWMPAPMAAFDTSAVPVVA